MTKEKIIEAIIYELSKKKKWNHFRKTLSERFSLIDLDIIETVIKKHLKSLQDTTEERDVDEIKHLCIEWLSTDGGHHKQYYLEQIIKKINPMWKNIGYEKWIPD